MSISANTGPELAVILSAYRRREYLPAALRSVLRQTVPRSRLEILVLTDDADPLLEATLAREGIALRVDNEVRIGRWLLGALHATRAPLVAFVDDDDLMEPDRFERALDVFRQNPTLSLYRNRLSVIDAHSQRVPRSYWLRVESERALDRSGPVSMMTPAEKEAGIRWMRSAGLEWLNVSTMVFRREVFTPELEPAIAASHCQDLFTFVAGVLSPGGVFLDDRRLTFYRRHPGGATRSLAWRRLHAADHARFASIAQRSGPRSLAEWLMDRARMLGRVVEAGEALEPVRARLPLRVGRQRTAHYLHGLATEPLLASPLALRWGAGAFASAYCLAPQLTHRLLRACDRAFDLP